MNYGPATFRRDGLKSAHVTRERRARLQLPRRPRTVATGERERTVDKTADVKKNSWLQRAKVYESSFATMKNKNAVKKQNSRSHMPQAYDIEEHLDCDQGVVVIGQNGVVTNDRYYVKCMKRSKPEPSTGSDADSFLSSEDESSLDTGKDKIPLCWKQQLQDKDMVRNCTLTLLFISSRILSLLYGFVLIFDEAGYDQTLIERNHCKAFVNVYNLAYKGLETLNHTLCVICSKLYCQIFVLNNRMVAEI